MRLMLRIAVSSPQRLAPCAWYFEFQSNIRLSIVLYARLLLQVAATVPARLDLAATAQAAARVMQPRLMQPLHQKGPGST